MPICIADKKLSGFLSSLRAIDAPLWPALLLLSSFVLLAETSAISLKANIPFNTIRTAIISISILHPSVIIEALYYEDNKERLLYSTKFSI